MDTDTWVNYEQWKAEEVISSKWTQLLKSTTNNERRTVHLTDIDGSDEGSIQQIEAVNLFLKIAGLYKNSEGEFIEPITQGQVCQNVMLVQIIMAHRLMDTYETWAISLWKSLDRLTTEISKSKS